MNQPLTPGAKREIGRLMRAAILARRPICLDTGPLIDYIGNQEPTASLIEPVLMEPRVRIVISTISLAESVVRAARLGDPIRIARMHQAILALPGMDVVDFDQEHAIEAAGIRVRTELKLPDAAIVATALLSDAIALLGNDRQWRTRPLGVPYYHVDDILAVP